jgi:hypothetical protein
MNLAMRKNRIMSVEMTSREIISANLAHNSPPRPGLNFSSRETQDWLHSSPEQNSFFKGRINDILCLSVDASRNWCQKRWVSGNKEFYDDEWGNIWVRMSEGCMTGEIDTPAIEDWEQLDNIRVPDFDDPRRYERTCQLFRESPDKFKIGAIPGWVFATSRYLRKMENYLCDLIDCRQEVNRLHSIISDLMLKIIYRFAEIGADGIIFYEDLGTQSGLLISPSTWNEVFKSHYVRLINAAHASGLKVIMHSCGKNCELLDDLICTGIDCFQFDQPAVYDMESLSAKLRAAKLALWAPIDIQHVLPTGDKYLIEAEAERMFELFKDSLIFKNYSDLSGIGVKPQWDMWGYDKILHLAKKCNDV